VAVTQPSDAPEAYPQAHNVVAQTARHHTPAGDAGRPRRIAMLAPPWIPVPPPGYGGIEEVVALLCDALVERGHEVELFCAPGSSSSAKVRPLLPRAHPESIERSLIEADHVALAFAAFDAAAADGRAFDVVHDHCGFTPLAMADRVALRVAARYEAMYEAAVASGADRRLASVTE
jgi:glycosyltransferase involved in cell wall biosynthesis